MGRQLAFICTYPFTYDCGIAVLDPTYHCYEDLFADMYVKTVFYADDAASNISTNKLREDNKGRLYFVKFGRRYYLDDMMRCDFCGQLIVPHEYKRYRRSY